MSKKGDLVKNTLIIAIGKAATQMSAFLLLPLYTYFLSPGEYGLADLVITYLIIAVPALTLQLELAAFRFLIDARDKPSEKTKVISNILYMVFPIALCASTVFVVIGATLELQYVELIILTAVAIMLSSLFLQITRGLGDNKRFAKASIIVGLMTITTAILFIATMKLGVAGMFLSLAISNLAGTLYLLISLRLYRHIKLRARNKEAQRAMIGYSAPLVPNGIAWWTTNAADRTVITIILGSAANGIYAVSSKYSAILSSLFSVFSMSWTESASLHINSKGRDQFFSDVASVAVRLFGSLSLVIIAAIPFVFSLLINKSFGEAYLYVPVLIISAFFSSIAGIYNSIYVAKKLTRQVMNTSIVSAIISITLTVVSIPFLGLYGAAIGTAIGFLSMAIFRHFDVQKHVRITYEKNMFVILFALSVIIFSLYYMATLWASLTGFAIATTAAYLLNRYELGRVKTMALGKIKKPKKA